MRRNLRGGEPRRPRPRGPHRGQHEKLGESRLAQAWARVPQGRSHSSVGAGELPCQAESMTAGFGVQLCHVSPCGFRQITFLPCKQRRLLGL